MSSIDIICPEYKRNTQPLLSLLMREVLSSLWVITSIIRKLKRLVRLLAKGGRCLCSMCRRWKNWLWKIITLLQLLNHLPLIKYSAIFILPSPQKTLSQSPTVLLTHQVLIKWNLKMVLLLLRFYLKTKKLSFTIKIKTKKLNLT